MEWGHLNKKELEKIRRILTESEYKQEFDRLPLRTIQKLFNGAEAEINRLQKDNNNLRRELEELKSKLTS